jgi:hypothetical protein
VVNDILALAKINGGHCFSVTAQGKHAKENDGTEGPAVPIDAKM